MLILYCVQQNCKIDNQQELAFMFCFSWYSQQGTVTVFGSEKSISGKKSLGTVVLNGQIRLLRPYCGVNVKKIK